MSTQTYSRFSFTITAEFWSTSRTRPSEKLPKFLWGASSKRASKDLDLIWAKFSQFGFALSLIPLERFPLLVNKTLQRHLKLMGKKYSKSLTSTSCILLMSISSRVRINYLKTRTTWLKNNERKLTIELSALSFKLWQKVLISSKTGKKRKKPTTSKKWSVTWT